MLHLLRKRRSKWNQSQKIYHSVGKMASKMVISTMADYGVRMVIVDGDVG